MHRSIATLEGDVDGLEDDVKDVNARTSFITKFVPEDIQQKLDDVQTQAKNLQNTVQNLSQRAEEIQSTVMSADAGSFGQRLAVLEDQIVAVTGSDQISALMERIHGLEQSVAGQAQLGGAVAELQGIVDSLDGKVGGLEQSLVQAQESGGALGETMEGVTRQDVKAAAMLIAFSQLRDSLNRDAPFEDDLALLQKMVGEDNQEVQDALVRLAPHANEGVLSPGKLSEELKGLTGDIVFSSLKGEEVSVMDKAKARLSNALKIEKDGEIIGATDTQKTVAQAQALLDQGDVGGAVALLKTLDGEAAQTAQPFIAKAEVTMLSGNVQGMLRDMILSNIGGAFGGALGGAGGTLYTGSGAAGQLGGALQSVLPPGESGPDAVDLDDVDLNKIKQTLENTLPLQNEVIKDEESGVTILPRQGAGFKGFSGGG